MKKIVFGVFVFFVLSLLETGIVAAATNNNGNNPCFLIIQACSNGFPNLSQDTIDIGIDIGADGTYDYWLSKDKSFNTEETKDEITPENWRNIVIRLDQYAGKKAKINIIDRSADYYIVVNSIRLNNADGKMVSNPVPNGFFNNTPDLQGWTILEGSLKANQLIVTDSNGSNTPSGTKFFSTLITGNQDKTAIESDAFDLAPISSFVYGQFAGPASAKFDNPSVWSGENGTYVYIDMGTTTQDPNGKYDDGVDIPLTGFLFDTTRTDSARNPLFGATINTSGFEGRKAQVVIVDIDHYMAIGADSIRMNYDNSVIRNGGFEEGFESGFPASIQITAKDDAQTPMPSPLSANPAGKIPGWTQKKIAMLDGKISTDANDSFTYFSWPGVHWSRSDRAWIGSGSLPDDDSQHPEIAGIELRSDVFVIQPIPKPSQNVFLYYNTLQTSSRINADGAEKSIKLEVDVNNNGKFGEPEDYTYQQANQGSAWSREQYTSCGINAWAYPEYRFYIKPEHQGKNARVYVTETIIGGWAWMGVDNFCAWDGSSAKLAFPNSDFENGDMTNWNEKITAGGITSWLGGTQEMVDAGKATHLVGDDHNTYIDGNFAASSAPDEVVAELWSNPFSLPKLTGSTVQQFMLY